jgi:hypothetical protein
VFFLTKKRLGTRLAQKAKNKMKKKVLTISVKYPFSWLQIIQTGGKIA